MRAPGPAGASAALVCLVVGCGGSPAADTAPGREAATERGASAAAPDARGAAPSSSVPLGSSAPPGRGPRCRPEGEAFEVGRADVVHDVSVVQLGSRAVFVWLERTGVVVTSVGEGRVMARRRLEDAAGREEDVTTASTGDDLFVVHGHDRFGTPRPADPCAVTARWLDRHGSEMASARLPLSRCPGPRVWTHAAAAAKDQLWVLGTDERAAEVRLVEWRPPAPPSIAARLASGEAAFARRVAVTPRGVRTVWGFGHGRPLRHEAAWWSSGRATQRALPDGIDFDLAIEDGAVVEWGPKRAGDAGPAWRALEEDVSWRALPGPPAAESVKIVDGVDPPMAFVEARDDRDGTHLVDALGAVRLPIRMTAGDVAVDGEHGTLVWSMEAIVRAQPLRCDVAAGARR